MKRRDFLRAAAAAPLVPAALVLGGPSVEEEDESNGELSLEFLRAFDREIRRHYALSVDPPLMTFGPGTRQVFYVGS